MSLVIVHGIPPKTSAKKLDRLKAALQQMVAVKEAFQPKEIEVFFPFDLLKRDGRNIVVLIYNLPRLHHETQREILDGIERMIKRSYFKGAQVLVFNRPADD
jgi:hypothetical protein